MFTASPKVGEAVDILLATSQESFPLVDGSGALVGMLSRKDILEAVKTSDTVAPIAPFARTNVVTLAPDETLDKALDKLNETEAVGVVGADGELQGLVTRQSLAEVMLIKTAQPNWRFARRKSRAQS